MTLPVGISTCTVTVGSDLDFFGDPASLSVTVTPVLGGNADNIVWSATGQSLDDFTGTFTATVGNQVSFVVPHVDQTGFVNGVLASVTMWAYTVTITATYAGVTKTRIKNVQPLVGQTLIDLDLVAGGSITSPVTAPFAPVTSVNGQTGAVIVDSGVVYVENYPRTGGETDDSPRLGRAITAAAALGAKVLVLGPGAYTLTTATTITTNNFTIRGAGKNITSVTVNADVVAFNWSGCNYPTLMEFSIICSTTARTTFPVVFNNCIRPELRSMYFGITGAGARKAGVYLTGASSSMGLIDSCVFDNACILIEADDVKICDSWVWGMTCDYAIAIRDGAASTVIVDTDIVSPLASTATGLAGIVVGDDGSAPFNAKMLGVYLDGNPTLNTRAGIHVYNGVGGVQIQAVHSNEMDNESIIIDSAYNVMVDGFSSYHNNRQGNGAPEILVTQTGGQPVENILLANMHFLQTTAVTGTAGPAIKVDSSVAAGQVRIENFGVKQPGGGGGYSLPEINVPVSGGYPTMSIRGRGQLGSYNAKGVQSILSGATNLTINLASPSMAYRPLPAQILLQSVGQPLPAYRIQYISDNQIFVAFASAVAANTDIHWYTHLDL